MNLLRKLFSSGAGTPLTEKDIEEGVTYEVMNITSAHWHTDGLSVLLFLRKKGEQEIKFFRLKGFAYSELFRVKEFPIESTIDLGGGKPALHFVKSYGFVEKL